MKWSEVLIVFFAGFILMLLYILLFRPVYDHGDASAYINYARAIAEKGNTDMFLHRSPLYAWILSPFIIPLGIEKTARLITCFQYFLIYLSGILLFSLAHEFINKRHLALIVTILFYLNLTGIFYGYMVLTETLTLFLLMLTVWSLAKGLKGKSQYYIFISGISASAAILCRFNSLPLLLVFLVIIIISEMMLRKSTLWVIIRKAIVFFLPVVILLNGFAFLNFQKSGFYGLFPMGGSSTVSRNAIISTINGDEAVSDDHKPLLHLFSEAGREYDQILIADRKGSLKIPGRDYILDKLYRGFQIFSIAFPELCAYFGVDPQKPEPQLSNALASFYDEIGKINRKQVWQLRLFSLFSSFRSSSGLVLPEAANVNLGKLPGWLIICYKVAVFVFSFFVFLASIIYICLALLKRLRPNEIILYSMMLYAGFLFINFSMATVADANRFKYPVEPFIILLTVYFISEVYVWFKTRWLKHREERVV